MLNARGIATTLLLLSAIALVACGESTKTVTQTAPTATAEPAAEQTDEGTAYDEALRRGVEERIEQMALKKIKGTKDVSSHCVADSERTFTCSTHATTELSGGYCAEIETQQRGTVHADGGVDWANTKTDASEPAAC